MKPPAVEIMRKFGLEPDPWQVEVLQAGHRRLLLNCCRQAGKSTAVAILGLAEAMLIPSSKVVLVSRSFRQSAELFRIVTNFAPRFGAKAIKRRTAEELELTNLSRVVCLPCSEETIRGYSRVTLLVIDEAARVPDDLYRAVRPMLAVSDGRMICLSTPYGKRGFFHDAWARGGTDWAQIEIPAAKVPRISAAFLEEERRALGESWFRQEYCCSFEALEGLVYPDFARCVVGIVPEYVPADPARIDRTARRVGGIDFGFRNPFAAIWGTLDRDDILWLTGEHYERQRPLSYHADRLPRDVTWYCDPAGAGERSELNCAGFTVRKGNNAIRPGIAAITARLENGTLRILKGRCPNLLAEAELYRYGDAASDRRAEEPVDDHNHALAALRYLLSRIDRGRQGFGKPKPSAPEPPADGLTDQEREANRRFWRIVNDDRYWIPLGSIPLDEL